MTSREVRAPSAPSQTSELGAWPSTCFQGWKWSLTKAESRPTASAWTAKSRSFVGANYSADALYPSLSTVMLSLSWRWKRSADRRSLNGPASRSQPADGRRRHGRFGLRQDHGREAAGRDVGLAVPGRRHATSSRERGKDERRHPLDRRRSAALAAQDRRDHRQLADARPVGRDYLFGLEAILPRHHRRRSAGRAAGLPQRLTRRDPPAHGPAPRPLHAGRLARQPVLDPRGTLARRKSDRRRHRRSARRDRRRNCRAIARRPKSLGLRASPRGQAKVERQQQP